MVTFDFLEKDPNLVDSFFLVKGIRKPSIYLIAVGAFEDGELKELFTVGKPPLNMKKYTFKLTSCTTNKYLKDMVEYFHNFYDGLIEGLD